MLGITYSIRMRSHHFVSCKAPGRAHTNLSLCFPSARAEYSVGERAMQEILRERIQNPLRALALRTPAPAITAAPLPRWACLMMLPPPSS